MPLSSVTPSQAGAPELTLTAAGAIILMIPASSFVPAALDDGASPQFRGALVVLALAALAALASLLVGARSHVWAYVLRAGALVLAVSSGQIVGSWALPVSILGSVTLVLSVVLLVLRLMGDHEGDASPDWRPGVTR